MKLLSRSKAKRKARFEKTRTLLTEKVRGYIEVCREISAAYGICHDRFIIVDRKEIFWSSREGVLSP